MEPQTVLHGLRRRRNAARAELAALAGRGRLAVAVDRSYPLTQAAAAHDYVRRGHARGKVILLP